MKSGIYMIKCKKNKKIYIGHSKNIEKRMKHHMNALIRGDHDNPYIQNAFKKYGEKCFEFKILELCGTENIIDREYFWIDHYDSSNSEKGFNIIYDDLFEKNIKKNRNNHGLLKYYLTDEGKISKNKQSLRSKSLWTNDQYKQKMSIYRKDIWTNPEYKKNQSETAKKRWKSLEYKEKFIKKWQDPTWKAETLKKQQEARERIPNYIEDCKKREKLKWENPNFKEKMCKIAKKKWEDPHYREKTLRKQQEAKDKLENGGYTDISRKKIVESSKKRWSDPEFREMMIRKQKEGKEKKRKLLNAK
jgi:group I intron endonuclease